MTRESLLQNIADLDRLIETLEAEGEPERAACFRELRRLETIELRSAGPARR